MSSYEEKQKELLNNYKIVEQINEDLNKRVEKLLDNYEELVGWLCEKHPNVMREYWNIV